VYFFPFFLRLNKAHILKHFKVTAEKIALGKVNFSKGILKQPDILLTAVCYWRSTVFFSYWSECSNASRKTACVFKNPKNAGMVRKITFHAKSYLFNLHEMFKNSGLKYLLKFLSSFCRTYTFLISYIFCTFIIHNYVVLIRILIHVQYCKYTVKYNIFLMHYVLGTFDTTRIFLIPYFP
jgi:hypothetical protein